MGEPWNIQTEIQGYSHVIAASKEIIPEVANKVSCCPIFIYFLLYP
jgi:hypothetical protein